MSSRPSRRKKPERLLPPELDYRVRQYTLAREWALYEALVTKYRSDEFTYFFACSDRVKIGRSCWPEDRIRQLTDGVPHEPQVLAVVPAYVISETEAHALWAHLRRWREWFELTSELRHWITRGGLQQRARRADATRRYLRGFVARKLATGRPRLSRPLEHIAAREVCLRDERGTLNYQLAHHPLCGVTS